MARHTFYNNMPQGATISYNVIQEEVGRQILKNKIIVTIGQLLKLTLDLKHLPQCN